MNKVLHALLISFLTLALAACVSSSNTEKKPQLVSNAEKFLTQGVNRYNKYEFNLAQFNFKKALHSYRSIDNPKGIVSSRINLARTAIATGKIKLALSHSNKARQILTSAPNKTLSSHLDLIDAHIAIENNETDKSIALLKPYLSKSNNVHNNFMAALLHRTQIAFDQNASDKKEWIKKYAATIDDKSQTVEKARLLRFKASLNTEQSNTQFKQALAIYREFAHRPGIAATLTEWAKHNSQKNEHAQAINKLERALFIRQDLQDTSNCIKILSALSGVYSKIGAAKEKLSKLWMKRLKVKNFKQWVEFTAAFDITN